jgi:hypothetical protein
MINTTACSKFRTENVRSIHQHQKPFSQASWGNLGMKPQKRKCKKHTPKKGKCKETKIASIEISPTCQNHSTTFLLV